MHITVLSAIAPALSAQLVVQDHACTAASSSTMGCVRTKSTAKTYAAQQACTTRNFKCIWHKTTSCPAASKFCKLVCNLQLHQTHGRPAPASTCPKPLMQENTGSHTTHVHIVMLLPCSQPVHTLPDQKWSGKTCLGTGNH